MYSQKNVLQVFVSKLNAPVAATFALAALEDGAIGLFNATTNVSAATVTAVSGGYFAFNDGGIIKKSATFYQATDVADIEAFAAATAHVETIDVPAAIVVGEYYQISVNVLTNNQNGDEIKKGVTKAITGDTTNTIAQKLADSINNSIARDTNPNIAVSYATGTITITALPYVYSPGRKDGGFANFKSFLTFPEEEAIAGTVTVAGTVGIGMGYRIYSKELFAMGNSDAVSRNEFRTGYPNTQNASVTGEYDVLSTVVADKGSSSNGKGANTAYANVPTPVTILTAFDSNGDAPAGP